ncbi:MAG: hypothetical protein MK078_17615 [Crocinitomicaceae bacterium]|nr:hypothetical protein [Crocinitomicaceae bacterium]
MKAKYLNIVILAILFFSCSDANDLLIGKWKKKRSDKKGKEEWSFGPAILEFNKDGSSQAGKFNLNDDPKFGTWEFN